MTNCPSLDQLDRWLNELLEPPEQAVIAAHIDGCPLCQEQLDRLTADSKATAIWSNPRPEELLRTIKENAPPVRRSSNADFSLTDFSLIPGYDLLEPIGRGGMGVVFTAIQHGVNRVVAVKMLHRSADQSEATARFHREGEVLGRLRHPNIVQVHEVGVADGRPFLVMEYVAGGSLARWTAGRPQPPAVAAGLIEQVARAVQHAHDHGTLHRDLKPGNILVDAEPPPVGSDDIPGQAVPTMPDRPLPTIKVTDFGLARPIDQDATFTRTGMIVGTPSYMAPEQVAGDEGLTPACDVYGAGAVLYELLTGRPPFSSANSADILVQVRHQDPVPPTRVIPSLPRDLNTICLKCLEKDPRRRYHSAAALAEDLRRWQAGEPILARPTGMVEKAWKWARRRRAAAALIVLGLALLFVGLPTVTALWLWADSQRRAADRELERSERSLYASNIAQAELYYRINYLNRTRHHLQACMPEPGRPDRRGWEWFYLNGLAHAEWLNLPHGPAPDTRFRAVYAVAFSPDGRFVAAGGGVRGYTQYTGFERGELVLWDTTTAWPAHAVSFPESIAVTALAFSTSNDRLVAVTAGTRGSPTATIQVHDARTGAILTTRSFRPIQQRAPYDGLLAVNPDGSRAAVRTETGVLVCNLDKEGDDYEIADAIHGGFARGGAEFIAVEVSGTEVHEGLSPSTGQKVRHVEIVGRLAVHALDSRQVVRESGFRVPHFTRWAVSPTGQRVVAVGRDGTTTVYPMDGADRPSTYRLGGFIDGVTPAAVTLDDRRLVTGGSDATVRVWDLASGRLRLEFRGHTNRVTSVALSPDGTRLASTGWDRVTKVWDLTRQPEFLSVGETPDPGAGRAEDFAFSSDGRELFIVRTPGGTLETWDTITGERKSAVPLDLATALSRLVVPGRTAAFSTGGDRLAAVAESDPTRVKVFETRTGRELTATEPHRATVRNLAISPDGSRIAVAAWYRAESRTGPEAELSVWDVATGARLLHVPMDGRRCEALVLSPDGHRLAVASRPNTPEGEPDAGPDTYHLRIWDVESGAEVATLDCGEDVIALAFDANGDRLAAATATPRLILWDARTATRLNAATCLEAYYHLAFAPDGRRLAGANREHLTLWDPKTAEEVLTIRGLPRTSSDRPWNPRVAFAPGGGRLGMAQRDYTVSVWTAARYPGARE